MSADENTKIENAVSLDLEDRQITYDRVELRGEFVRHLDELFARLQSEETARIIGGELSKKIADARIELGERLRGKFRVVVMGDFKRGKSTLVNALLETNLVPTDITPETLTINEISYGERLAAQICLADKGRLALSAAELFAEQLAPLVENLAAQKKVVTHLEIEAPVEWLKNAFLVDTPGLGDVLGRFDAAVQNYISKADTLIYLISAVSPLSQTEADFLRLSIEPQEFPKIIFVVNMLDLAQSDANAVRVLAHISEQIAGLFPNAQLYGLSAFDEVCRLKNEPRPNISLAPRLEKNFTEFRSHLQNCIELDRDTIQLDRAGDLLRLSLFDFNRSVEMLAAALDYEQSALAAAVAELSDLNSDSMKNAAVVKQKLRVEIAELGEQAVEWLGDFFNRLTDRTVRELSDFQFDEVQRNFHFFLSDSLREAAAQCGTAHRAPVTEAALAASRALNAETPLVKFSELENETLAAAAAPAVHSKMESFGNLVSYLPSVGIYLELGSRFISKNADNSKKLQNYCEHLSAVLPDLRLKTIEKVRASYQATADQIEAQLDENLSKEKAARAAAFEQARAIQETGRTKTSEATETLKQLQKLFDNSNAFVQSLTRKLWAETNVLR